MKEERTKPDLGRVKEMQKNLYAKNVDVQPYKRHGFNSKSTDSDIPTSWNKVTDQQPVDLIEKNKQKNKDVHREPMTVFTKILLASMLFFIFSVGGAFMVFTLGKNEVSYDAVDISVLGPNSVAGGDQLVFSIDVVNQNPVDIVLTDIAVNYPKGTVTADGQALPLDRDVRSIDSIKPGFSTTTKFSSILFGKEGDIQDIKITYQYRVPGSNSLFFKERQYSVQLESSPVVLRADHAGSYQNGENLFAEVVVESNAAKTVQNLLLQIDYPFGFDFASSTPVSADGKTFVVGDLEPGESRTFTLQGSVAGQEGEQRTFRYTLGTAKDKERDEVGTVFATTESVFALRKPPIELILAANDNLNQVYAVRTEEDINLSLAYKNTLLTKLLDTQVGISLAGLGYDIRSIDPRDGYYRSSNQSITWSGNNVPDLRELEPGESGELEMRFRSASRSALAGVQVNPEILVRVESQATNFQDGGEEESVQASISKKIKVATDVGLDARVLYEEGPFENSGPRSPRVGENTTYTLQLRIVNTTSDIQDAAVSFQLPPYVSLRELQQPLQAQVDYDARTRTVTWNPDKIKAGTGYATPPEELFLSLSYEPSLDHVGRRPSLVSDISLQAVDSWSELTVRADKKEVTTSLPDPSGSGLGEGTVRE